jgi:CheY-like chemotaxis protein
MSASIQQKKVIVVDDDPDILEALQAMLEDAGYLVLTTEKGEYLEQLHNGRLPDLILLDMLLSGKDGRDIARFLRGQEETKNIPIVMMSAHPSAEAAARAAGATDFIAKPFEMDALLKKVAQYIG